MIVARDLEALPPPSPPSIVSIGNFDGVHRGHQAILAKVVARARRLRGSSTVVTFDPHPARVLHPDHAPPMILPLSERIRLVEKMGIERMLVLPFTLAFSRTSAVAFVEEVLVRGLRCQEAYLGRNFRFGRDREGSVDLLRELGPRLGFKAEGVREVRYRDFLISSTLVRSTLADGQVALARRLLGRPFTLLGKVVRGEARGGGLDFPTANLEVDNEVTPREGVYITRAILPCSSHPAATNIGRRPTFGGHRRVTEAHLLDFTGDLYGAELRLDFLRRLRDERVFTGAEALRAQIQLDVTKVRRYFCRSKRSSQRAAPGRRLRA
ncbi:MAG: bifunctional riboflavin kinase/FAD synthetase [Acidobacteriota bacterium]